jgi:2-polyprenyl-6-methoxyphenol hydroxylase-like FAD-dependent oxidoreductase
MVTSHKECKSDVLVVGAGPVGLTLAAELARHGIRPRIVDRLKQPLPYCRAIGVTSRTLEVWDDMGIARDMIDAGLWIDKARSILNGKITDSTVDLSDLPFSQLGLPQNETERLLTRHVSSFGVEIERGVSLEDLAQADGRVRTVLLDCAGDREEASFRYVVGCDGAHSAVRRAAGIAFEGSAIPATFMLGDVRIDWSVPRGMIVRLIQPVPDGPPDILIVVPLPEPGRYRVSIIAPPGLANPSGGTAHGFQSEAPAAGIEPLQAVADKLLPEKAVLSDLRWSSIFRISMRLAAQYRRGNVFIAGDAAHIHPPTGGQGMNTGIQDAYNLAWKMALVLRGVGDETLLESYEAERHPVGEEVVARTTRSIQTRNLESESRLADTQILISYRGSAWIECAIADGEQIVGPAAGDRAPDCHGLRRQGVGFPYRLFDVLRGVEHVLIAYCPGPDSDSQLSGLAEFGAGAGLAGFLRLVAIVEAGADAKQVFTVPVYQDVDGGFKATYGSTPFAMLVRPDGHLAWRGESWREPALWRQLDRTFVCKPPLRYGSDPE